MYLAQYTLLMIRLAPFYEKPMTALPSASPWRLLSRRCLDGGSTMRPAHAAVARYVRGLRPSGFAGNRVIALKFIQASSDFYWSRGSSTAFHRRGVTRVRGPCKPRILGVALPTISGPKYPPARSFSTPGPQSSLEIFTSCYL